MAVNRERRPVDEDGYRRVAELHALGMGRNAIAREIGRAQRTDLTGVTGAATGVISLLMR
ncbi:hypothetical protein ABT121_06800 [Streptomyces sp. NPDC001928]|uniref:hypothetical protein n=1 Tax=Streptomyces sp. NPDC001928 TaxID=3154404 RepID=UPI00332BADAC